jgi:hypothetical protein
MKKERKQLKHEQAKKVMPLIGPLLDAWDGLPNDLSGDDELSHLSGIIEKINAAMEGRC